MRQHLAPVTRPAPALSTPRRLPARSALEFARAFAALALAPKQSLLKVSHLGLRKIEFDTKRRLALLGLDPLHSQFSSQPRLCQPSVFAQFNHRVWGQV